MAEFLFRKIMRESRHAATAEVEAHNRAERNQPAWYHYAWDAIWRFWEKWHFHFTIGALVLLAISELLS